MTPPLLFAGTHRRPHRADPADIAFGLYAFRPGGRPDDIVLTPSPQPGWIAIHPNGRFLYAANEVSQFQGAEGGGISAFAIDPERGLLTLLGARPVPALPCHCQVDPTGQYLLVATFGGGTVHLFPLLPDGRIGAEADSHRHAGSSIHPRRQTQPHPHAVVLDPGGCFVLVPDLGTDQIVVYELGPGRLIARPERNAVLPPGSGPRHLCFDPTGRFVYLINEMSATITAFAYDGDHGALREIQNLDLLPENFPGLRSGAEVGLHPGGRFLYATTRSHGSSGEPPVRGLDNLVWFEIGKDGLIALRGRVPSGGEIPRSFCFDDSGAYLFVGHQASGTVVTFRIDSQTGAPTPSGEMAAIPVAVCLALCPRIDATHGVG
jgi:6-phosphogluconolactonase